MSQLLAHVKLPLCRRAAARDAGVPAEVVCHFNKVLDAHHGGVVPHSFATAYLVGRAAAFRASGQPADAIGNCSRVLALGPAFIPALRQDKAPATPLLGSGWLCVTTCFIRPS